jgi:hypothetical protein
MSGAPLPELLATVEETNAEPVLWKKLMPRTRRSDDRPLEKRNWEDEFAVIKAQSTNGVKST